jgi:hypothetical protein
MPHEIALTTLELAFDNPRSISVDENVSKDAEDREKARDCEHTDVARGLYPTHFIPSYERTGDGQNQETTNLYPKRYIRRVDYALGEVLIAFLQTRELLCEGICSYRIVGSTTT